MIIPSSLPSLTTDRLLLRPMEEEDAKLVVAWRNHSHVSSMSDQSKHVTLTIPGHLKWFKESRSYRVDYIIICHSSNQPIGSLSFTSRDRQTLPPEAEIGNYIGDVNALGRGYAKESLRAWIDFGFNELHLSSILAKIRRENAISLHLYASLGFQESPNQDSSGEFIFMALRPEIAKMEKT